MKIAIVAPSPVPFTRGGAERAWSGLQRAIETLAGHDVELVKLPVKEDTLANLVDGYASFNELDVTHFDLVITSKYPAWMVRHPRHVVWMFHPLRGVYDTYATFGLPERPEPTVRELRELVRFLRRDARRSELDEFFALWEDVLDAAGPDHPDLALPSPVARVVIRWLDRVALSREAVTRHTALSRTVANRSDYFPADVVPQVAYAPSDLTSTTGSGAAHLFTASRLDHPKRLDLLVRAMSHVPGDLPLLIGGAGPQRDELESLASGDPRIRFLGFVADDALPHLYADSVAVPFVPADEDYGLITVEAMSCGRPIITCADSGGPAELVVDRVTGLIAQPTPESLGAAIAQLVGDRPFADRLGAAARRRAAEITWSATVSTLLGETVSDAEPTRHEIRRPAGRTAMVRDGRQRVVALTTFGIADPRHGGQLRCNHLYGALAHHIEVEVVALVEDPAEAGHLDISSGLHQTGILRSASHREVGARTSAGVGMAVTDIVAGTHIAETPAYLAHLRDTLRSASLVLLAEPYLVPALDLLGSKLPRLYDAFNVEAELKAISLPATEPGGRLLDVVLEVERRAVTTAAAITTCSSEDAKRLSITNGTPISHFTVVPNGTDCSVRVPSPASRTARSRAWRRAWSAHRQHGVEHGALAVFFASWHPPNLAAAEILLWLAPQLPDVQFVLGGSHGDAFTDRVPPENLVFTGPVGEQAKRTLLASADVALNPMLQGSGTNLKVIEYLAAGVPVVSTGFGVRGLNVVDGEHLIVAEPHQMVEAVRSVLDDPQAAARRAAAGRALAQEQYDWQALGDRMAAVVGSILRS